MKTARKLPLIEVNMTETWAGEERKSLSIHIYLQYDVKNLQFYCDGTHDQGHKCSLTQYSLSQSSKIHVSCLEGFFPLLIQRKFLAFDQNGGAAL